MSTRRQRLVGALAVTGLIGVVVIPVPVTQKSLEVATARAFDAPFPGSSDLSVVTVTRR
jgi:hypothetical protein